MCLLPRMISYHRKFLKSKYALSSRFFYVFLLVMTYGMSDMFLSSFFAFFGGGAYRQLSKVGMNVMITNNGQEAIQQWLAVERGYYTIAIFDHVSFSEPTTFRQKEICLLFSLAIASMRLT